MQIGFICPDGENVLFEDCLKGCCMKERCVSKPTISALSVQRKWEGLPSVTQLLGGTRHAYLKIVKDYFENIQKLAFALLGTQTHKQLEDACTNGMAELAFKSKIHSGISDYYEKESKTLFDYKTSGSYQVKKALGLVSYKVDDPTGATYKRAGSGFRKGDIKQVTKWRRDSKAINMPDWILQTNRYAIWMEEAGMPVEQIKVEVIVRDGGLRTAISTGVDKNIVVIDIPIISREYVLDYFKRKADMLRMALAIGWSPRCSDEECWQGKKCENFCAVWSL